MRGEQEAVTDAERTTRARQETSHAHPSMLQTD